MDDFVGGENGRAQGREDLERSRFSGADRPAKADKRR
jgi:hypothetical protein